MKPSIHHLWWNPFQDIELDFPINVSISIDTMTCDENADLKILFMAEPPSICPEFNDKAVLEGGKFDKIYCFNYVVLGVHKLNAEMFEWGSTWLNIPNLKFDKEPIMTFVTSSKADAEGHKLRLEIYDYLETIDYAGDLEIFQHKSPPFHQNRNDFFNNAMFHIAVENSMTYNYFTEKLIDCFASRTIPIYYGCVNIGDWFDTRGIIQFSNLNELKYILDNITSDEYARRLLYVEENFNRAKEFYGENDVVPRITRKIKEYVNASVCGEPKQLDQV